MHLISNFLAVLGLISFFLMIAGLIRPRWVLICAEQRKTRLRALPVLGGLCLSLAVAASATEPMTTTKAKIERHQIVRGMIPASIQPESTEAYKAALNSNDRKAAINKTLVGATEEALLQFLQKNGFKKEKSLYLHHPDASHPLRPYVALAYKYDSKGLKFFQLDNWYSDPTAAATIPSRINMKLESMEASLLTELLGTALGNTLAAIRRELITSQEGDVFSLTLNGRKLYGFITSGGGSVVFTDDDSPLGKGKYRKTPKQIALTGRRDLTVRMSGGDSFLREDSKGAGAACLPLLG